jgi:serine protease AprX
VATLAATLMLAPALPATTHAAANKVHPKLTSTATGELVDVLVTLDPSVDWSAVARTVSAKFIKHWALSATVRLQVPADKLTALSEVPGVRWVTPNARVVATGLTTVSNTFASTVQAPALWSMGLQGDGVTVAMLDTGIATNRDLPSVLSFHVDSFPDGVDRMGHGTAVAGLIVGASPNGAFRGIAPHARLISMKVLGDDGSGTLADVLNGLEWVNQNRRQYNIRVVNLSLTSGVVDSYKKNPINAAVEALWFKA